MGRKSVQWIIIHCQDNCYRSIVTRSGIMSRMSIKNVQRRSLVYSLSDAKKRGHTAMWEDVEVVRPTLCVHTVYLGKLGK